MELVKAFVHAAVDCHGVDFSLDAGVLATVGDDGRLVLWDIERGEPRWEDKVSEGAAWDVVLAPDGKGLVVGSSQRLARYRLTDGRREWSIADRSRYSFGYSSVAVDPSGARCLAGRMDESPVDVFDVASRKRVMQFMGQSYTRGIVFAPSGKRVASLTAGGVALWEPLSTKTGWRDSYTGPEVWLVLDGGEPNALAFRPDGHACAAVSTEKTLCFWSIPNEGKGQSRKKLGAERTVTLPDTATTIVWREDAPKLVVGFADGSVRAYDESGEELAQHDAHSAGVSKMRLAGDGKHLATASEAGEARLWRLG